MNFISPIAGFGLYEINLYPYVTWIFYGVLLLLSPYLLRQNRRLFTLFLVSLAFESALIINAGFFIRPSYSIGLVLVLKTVMRLGLKFPARYGALLTLFVLTGIAGIFLNLDLIGASTSGESRATFLRPIIQLGQLTTMIFIAVSVFTQLSQKRYFRHTVRVLHFVSVGVALYAIWEIAAIYFNLPYLNLDSMRQSYWYIGFGTPLGYVFRPHGTFIEPIELNNFQFLGIASSLAYRVLYDKRGWRYWSLLFLQLAVLVESFSRSTLVTVAVFLPIFFLFYPRVVRSALGFFVNRSMRLAVVALAVFMIIYGFRATPEGLKQVNPVAQVLYGRIVSAQRHAAFGFSPYGRADASTEIEPLRDQGKLGFGVGIGNDANWRGGVGGTASLYSQIIIHAGLIGLMIFLVFLGSLLYGLFRNYLRRSNDIVFRKVCWIFFVGLLAMLTQRLAFSGLFTDTYLWVAFAMCIYLGQKKQYENWD